MSATVSYKVDSKKAGILKGFSQSPMRISVCSKACAFAYSTVDVSGVIPPAAAAAFLIRMTLNSS
ncbi:MAG: hypothetical protein RLO18_04305, partial [Gimesia chilikensis]